MASSASDSRTLWRWAICLFLIADAHRAFQGNIPLVVNVESADIIATLLVLKKEVEAAKGNTIRLTITGATEAHLLAEQIGRAGVGVILHQRPYPSIWEQKRILPGPPLTQSSAIATLVAHNVTVGIQVGNPAGARNTRFDMAWASAFRAFILP